MGTQAAMETYEATKPGTSYADTSVIEEDAWQALCQVYGTRSPKTDHDRLTKLLRLCEAYQGHDKTKRTLIKQLRLIGKTITTVPYTLAAAMVEASATASDEIEAQMDKTPTPNNGDNETRQTQVNMVGTSACCPICNKAGHVSRDFLIFMQNEGTCGHWFMHSIGRYKTGCRYGDACTKRHARPEKDPEVSPQQDGGEQRGQQVKVAAASVSVDAADAAAEATKGSDIEGDHELPTAERQVLSTSTSAWQASRRSQMATRADRRGTISVLTLNATTMEDDEDGDFCSSATDSD